MPQFARHHLAALLAALYGLVSALWILISDHVVQGLASNALQLTQLQNYKGWAFVLISTVIVYALLKAGQRSRLISEAAAREQAAARDQLSHVFDCVPGAIYVFRRTGDGRVSFPYVSRAIDDIIGITTAQLQADASRVAAHIHPEDLAQVQASVESAARDLSPWRATFRVLHPVRGELWIDGRSTPIRQTDGSILWYGILNDLTARQRYKRALLESEERLRLAHEAGDIGTWLHDIPGDRIRADSRASTHFGVTGSEFSIATIQSHVHPDDLVRLRATIAAAVDPDSGDGRYATEYRVVHPDGSIRWVSIHARVHFEQVEGKRRAVMRVGTTQDITQRVHDEHRLRDSEERLRVALDAADLGTFRHDLRTDVLYYDARAADHYGHGRTSWRWSDLLDVVHPEDIARLRAALQEATDATRGDGRFAVQYRIIRPDGDIRWISVQALVHFEGAGAARRAIQRVGTIQDVTQRVRTETALRESETRWQFALEGTEQGMWDWHIGTGEVYLSDRWKAMRGHRPDEVPGHLEEWAKRVHPDDLPRVQADLDRHLQGRDPFYQSEYRVLRKDGSHFWVLDRGKVIERDAAGQPLRMIGTNADIGARKAMEAALRESEARANLIIDTAPDAMMVVGAEGRIVRANARAARLFGYAIEDMLRLQIEALIPARFRERHQQDRARYASSATPRSMGEGLALFAVKQDGSEFPVEVSLGPLPVSGEQQTVVMLSDISQRREAELKIQRLAEIVKTSADLLALIDGEGRYQVANPAYAAMFGTTPESIQGMRKEDVLPPQVLAQVELAGVRARAGEQNRVTVAATFADGCEHVLEMDYRPFIWNGVIAGVVASGRDVTERTRAEQALRDSETALARAQNMAHVGSWTLDIATRVFQRSDEASRIIGVPAGRVSWDAAMATVYADDVERVQQAWARTLAGEPYDIEHRSVVNGQVRWSRVKAEVMRNAAGVPVKAFGMTQDVTEIREAQLALEAHREHLERLVAARTSELRQQTRYLRTLIDGFPHMVWLKDTEHRYLAVNRRSAEVMKWEVGNITGKRDIDLFPPEFAARYRDDDEDVIRTRQPKLVEEPLERGERTVWLETYKAPVLDEDGSILGTVGYARDITERRAAERAREQALTEATRLAQARSDFLANMSHEIRTPLNAVLGLAQLGARATPSAQCRDTFGQIVDSGRLLLGIVNDILDFAKIEAGKLQLAHEPFELGTAIDQAIAMVNLGMYEKGLRLEVHEAPDLPSQCEGDALRLAQVLVNLLSNAMKFTTQGRVALRVARDDADLVFEVEDSGIGMTSEQMARMFTPFQQADGSTTRRFGGTGLGLSISKHLVEAMGGSIHASSTPGAGSRFTVRLPAQTHDVVSHPVSLAIVLAGLDTREAEPLAEALRARGCSVRTGPVEALDADDYDLAVCEGAGLNDQGRVLVESLTQSGRRIALAGVPDGSGRGNGNLRWIDRPLRARQVIAHVAATFQASPESPGRRLAGLRVLAAEDNEVNRLVLEEMFLLEGGEVVLVDNGRRALERLEQDGVEHYDIVLTDVQMPEMDGYEAARQIRARGWTFPILGLTAHAMSEERERCLAAGMSDYLAKPFDIDTLVTTILRLCSACATSSAPAPAAGAACLPAGQAGHGAIDWDALHKRFPGKQAFLDRLVGAALHSYEALPARLREAARQRDYPSISFIAHSVRGTSANLFAHRLNRLARETESSAKASAPAALQLSTRLAVELERLLGELQKSGTRASMERDRI